MAYFALMTYCLVSKTEKLMVSYVLNIMAVVWKGLSLTALAVNACPALRADLLFSK